MARPAGRAILLDKVLLYIINTFCNADEWVTRRYILLNKEIL